MDTGSFGCFVTGLFIGNFFCGYDIEEFAINVRDGVFGFECCKAELFSFAVVPGGFEDGVEFLLCAVVIWCCHKVILDFGFVIFDLDFVLFDFGFVLFDFGFVMAVC